MPVLKPRTWTQEEKNQLKATLSLIYQDAFKTLLEPIRQANDSVAKAFSLGISIPMKELAEQFAKMSIPQPINFFPRIPQTSYFPEIIEHTELIAIKPQGIIRQKKKEIEFQTYHEKFSIGITKEGTFYYRNRLISYISTSSKHGRLLKLLLGAESNYLTDRALIENLHPQDLDKGLGYIREDLRKYLAKNLLKIHTYRSRKQGYKLVKITKVKN